MNVLEHVAQTRETYLRRFRDAIRQFRDAGTLLGTELVVRADTPDQGPVELCVDLLSEADGKQEMHMIWDEPEEGPQVGALRVRALEVAVFAYRWESCPVWARMAGEWPGIAAWLDKWSDRERAVPDEDGLAGVVHYVSPPTRTGAGFSVEVDFGSAPVEAFAELLEAIAAAGATEIRVGIPDGSQMDPALVARLSAPTFAPDDLLAVMVELLSAEESVERVEPGDADMELVVRWKGGKEAGRAYLGNLWRHLQRVPPEGRPREVMRQMQAYADMAAAEEQPDLRQLRPVIKDDQFMASVNERAPKAPRLAARRLAGDLWVCYVWDSPGGMRFVQESEPAVYGLSFEQADARALQNYLDQRNPIETEDKGPVTIARTGDSYDATLILDHAFWKEQAAKGAGELLACVPWRNFVLFTSTGKPGGEEMLRKLARQIEASGDHLVSQTVLRWTASGWTVHAAGEVSG